MHYFNVDTEKWDIEDSDITLFPFEDTYPFVLMSKDTQLVHPTVKGSREWKYLDQMTILPTYDTPCVKCKTRRRRKLKNSDKRVKISSPSDGYYRYDIVCNECSEKDQSEKGSEDMEVEVPNPFQPEIPVAQGKPIESKKTQTRRTRKVRDRNSFIIESINSIIASFSEHTVCLLIIIHIKKFCKDEKISKLVKDASLRLKPLLEKLDNDLLSDEVTSVLFNLSQGDLYI